MHIKHLCLFFAIFLASCASSVKQREENIVKPSAGGDFQNAINNVEKNKKKLYNSEDVFLYEFDTGLLHHYNQNYRESIKHLANAEQIIDDLYTRSVTNEATAILTNDNVRPYRSYPFEIQWMHKIQILNYLALGEIDGAAVQSRRAQLAIQSLEEKEGDKFIESGALHYIRALAFEWQKSEDDARIAYYHANKNFANLGYTPKLAADVPQNAQEIIIIGYAGISPNLGENKFWGTYSPDGALFLNYKDANGKNQTILLAALGLGGSNFSGRTMTVQFAIPKILDRASQTSKFSVAVNGNQNITETFANTKISLQKDFESGQNATLIRTAGRVIIRTIAANKAKDKTQIGNPLLNLGKNLLMDVGTGLLEEADLRLGSAMPLTFQITRIPVEPGKHSIKIDVLDYYGRKTGSMEQTVNIKSGEKIFIFAPSLR